jgi:hypothetical protein
MKIQKKAKNNRQGLLTKLIYFCIDICMMSDQRTAACKGCPFSKKSESGKLGGSPIETYLGQIIGPFFLPCHAAKGYKGNDEKIETCKCQCAGAAVFRANLGLDSRMPAALLRLPAHSDPNVFESLEEFVRHHRPELSEAEVEKLTDHVDVFFYNEYQKALAKNGVTKVQP